VYEVYLGGDDTGSIGSRVQVMALGRR